MITIKKTLRLAFLLKFIDKFRNAPPEINVLELVEDNNVWNAIFLRCDYQTLAQLYHSCRRFHKILRDPKFWIEKCIYDNIALPPLAWRKYILANPDTKNFNYKNIYRKNPYGRNLFPALTKEDTINKLERITQLEHGGDGFTLEPTPISAIASPAVPNCLVTSFDWCRRYYEINLAECGIEDWVMDKIRPKITISEMSICRVDCGADYEFAVQLLKENEFFDRNAILPRFARSGKHWEQWEGGREWTTTTFEFSEYPAGIRAIGIYTQGKDSQFWKGWYGAKFGNTRVSVEFPENVIFKQKDEFNDPEKKFIASPMPLRGLRHNNRRGFALRNRLF